MSRTTAVLIVMAILSASGRITIPKRIRAAHKLRAGTRFILLAMSSREIILRPFKRRSRHANLLDNLLALSGLPIRPERVASRTLEL